MTKDVLVADNGSLVWDGPRLKWTPDMVDKTRQELIIRLRRFEGEWFLDKFAGMSYSRAAEDKTIGYWVVAAQAKSIITNTPNVAELNEFGYDYIANERRLYITFVVTLTDGSVIEGAV